METDCAGCSATQNNFQLQVPVQSSMKFNFIRGTRIPFAFVGQEIGHNTFEESNYAIQSCFRNTE